MQYISELVHNKITKKALNVVDVMGHYIRLHPKRCGQADEFETLLTVRTIFTAKTAVINFRRGIVR